MIFPDNAKVEITGYCCIDCDIPVFIPDKWTVLPNREQLPNRVLGKIILDPTSVEFYLDDGQKDGKYIIGEELRGKLATIKVYTAHVLDYFLNNPHSIPNEWRGKYITFWGTIYSDDRGCTCVRGLNLGDNRLNWGYHFLAGRFYGAYPAACAT
ncbi:MAG: hypothetical protein WC666_02960 [Candidatus Paceibacterota bacterium]|jgi:hypothetical protein